MESSSKNAGNAKFDRLGWGGPVLSAVAFLAVFAAFVWQLVVYWENVRAASDRDLQSRADLAAIVLAEPLKTLDFRAIHAFGDKCQADGLRLRICHGDAFHLTDGDEAGRKGFFDTANGDAPACLFKTARAGSYWIGVGKPLRVLALPFLKALVVIALAGLAGVVGVVLFFAAIGRQRIRIRELARLEKFRREFIADVSHEIKTPLTGILGAAEMMEDEIGGTSRMGAKGGMGAGSGTGAGSGMDAGGGMLPTLVGMVRKEGARLNALVQQILDLARLEREDEALNPELIDLAELVRETVARHAPFAESKGVSIVVDQSSPATLAAHGDPTLLAQALDNLVVNAIRHSGSPVVRVACGRTKAGVRLVVEDDGCGIPPDEAARVFERFHRVDPARAAESGGAGLGLAIVRRIARLHGGEATYAPLAPHGSRFAVEWR